jgi:ParB-like chromosome segregation protein Spo0J
MQFHPLADIFPLMGEHDLARLAADIATNGQLEPIYTYEEMILDGRNRFLAASRLGIEPSFEAWQSGSQGHAGEALAFVIARNLHRRHLNESQRAMAATRLATLAQGRPASSKGSSSPQVVDAEELKNAPIGAFSAEASDGLTVANAAELLNVGQRSVNRARMVLDEGDETLLAAVDEGLISVNDAARIVKRPQAVQRGAVEAVRAGKAKTAAAGAEQIERTRPTQRSAPARGQGYWPTQDDDETVVVRRRDLVRNAECLRKLVAKVTKIRGMFDGAHLHSQLDDVLSQITSLESNVKGFLAEG